MQETQHPGTLPVTLGACIAYKICLSALIFLYLEHKNKYSNICYGHFTNFSCICEPLTLCSLRVSNTNMV